MAGSRMTFVAEFVDRLTGPSTKAKKAVEDLGKATADAAKKSEQANRRAETADQRLTQAIERSAKARAGAARKVLIEETKLNELRGSGKAKASQLMTAEDRVAAAREKYIATSRKGVRDIAAYRKEVELASTKLGGSRSASARTADAIQQMATRSNRSVSGMQSVMDRLNPGRMASRHNSALGRMLSRTEQVSGKIQGHLDKINNSGAMRGAQAGATVVGGMALAGGVKRIADVQQANVVLETMGVDQAGREDLTKRFTGLAQNTPYSTGSVSNLGAGLIASGLDQSKVDSVLQGAIDTGALFDMSLEEIGLPLRQIQATGYLQGDDMAQLRERNIPIEDWLARQKGVDRSEIKGMVSKGQVSSDDVFQALAANSKGGAERAAGTLKGSWTNFLSSISQGGQAFLTPLVGPLTDLLKGAKDTITTMKPALSILGQVTGVIVKGLTPALPVLIPLVVGLGGGLLALAAAAKAALVVKSLAGGLGLIRSWLGGRGRGRGATGAVGLFTESLGGMRDSARDAYGQRGLGGLNAGLDTSTKKMGKAERAAGTLAKGIGLIGLAAAGLDVVGKGIDAVVGDLSTDTSMAGNQIQTGNLEGLDKSFSDSAWNKQPLWKRMLTGSDSSQANSVGEAITNQAYDQAAPGRKATEWINSKFITTRQESQNQAFSEIDSQLAGQAGSREAGAAFARIVDQSVNSGGNESLVLSKFPQYKQAVADKLGDKGVSVDDNSILQYMKNGGFRSGGFTGVGASTEFAGPAHRGEFYFNAEQTRRIGVPKLKEFARSDGMASPVVRSGDTTSVQVNVDASGATVEAAQAVGQSVEEAVARVLARRERRASNRHGTRELRGAR